VAGGPAMLCHLPRPGSATQVELLLQGMSGNEVAMLLAAWIWIALSVLVFLGRASASTASVTLEFCNSWEVWLWQQKDR